MEESFLSQDFYVLFVDDEKTIRKGLSKLYRNKFNILTASGVDEAYHLLAHNKIGIAVVDFDMPDKNGLELLEIIHMKFPSVRRIMLTGSQDLNLVKTAINEGKVHNFVNKPIDNEPLDKLLRHQAENYLKWETEEKQKAINVKDAIAYRKELSNRNKVLFRTLLNFEKKELKVLGTQISEIVNEYRLHMNEILLTQKQNHKIITPTKFLQLRHILRDCELLVNKFQLTKVQPLIQLLYANIYLLSGDVSGASDRSERCRELIDRMDDDAEKDMFRLYIEEFELLLHQKNLIIDNIMDDIYLHLENLLAFDVTKLTRLSTNQFMIQEKLPIIGYVIIIKDQLPIYTISLSPRLKVEPDLITNFVVALTMFAIDVFSFEGSLNVISHDLGVILIHQASDNLLFLVIANNETIGLRAGLREFAEETTEYITKLHPNIRLNEDDKFITERMEKYFSIDVKRFLNL